MQLGPSSAHADGYRHCLVLELRGSVPAAQRTAHPQYRAAGSVQYLLPDMAGAVAAGEVVDPHPAPGIPYMKDMAASRPSPWTLIGRTTGYTWAGSELVDR